MRLRLYPCLIIIIVCLSLSLLIAQTDPDNQENQGTQSESQFFSVKDIQPGMKGIGKTCFRGDNPEEFQVEILGVLSGMEPGASAVLARLDGEWIRKTGVFEGMSGSPVYIDGRLLGAVAFTYPYAKEAICGITPITQMVDSFSETVNRNIEFSIDVYGSLIPGDVVPEPRTRRLPKETVSISTREGISPESADFKGHALVPIATPLSLGGLDSKTLSRFHPKFSSMGLSMLQGAGGTGKEKSSDTAAKPDDTRLEPGSNIVIPLIRGDLEVSAGGTVTHIEGNKIYAFGHSLLDLGFTDLPVHKARTMLIFPSLESSFKILEMGDPVGTIRQDRGMGVYGFLGDMPRMMPLNVQLTTSRGATREFRYELVRDRLLTPLLVNLAVYNTIAASERGQGPVTIDIQGDIRIKNEKSIQVYNRFSSDRGVADAISLEAALPVNYLMTFGYKNLDIEAIDLAITSDESDQSALLDSIRLDRMEAKAGDSLEIEVSVKRANGETIRNLYPLEIPANIAPGPLNILVADGTTLMSMDDQQATEEVLVPRNLTHLIQLLNNLRKNDRLYVRLFRREPGAVVRGEGLPGLPPSILSILGSSRETGAVSPIDISTFQEYVLPPTAYLAAGSKMLTIMIKP